MLEKNSFKENMMSFTFNHFNFNVTDLEKSKVFYAQALGLHETRRAAAEDGSYILIYLGDGRPGFELELTWLKEHPQHFDLGENEIHLALEADDYAAAHEKHRKMGIICLENPSMGIYFIEDPDGYWIEIIPPRDR